MPPVVFPNPFQCLRSATREAAGLSSYDPSAASADTFSLTLRDVAAALDRSTPPYLRCDRCHVRLFRGLQSIICVFCGAEPRRELPVSIAFTSTCAYRNLLRSLDVDGTELVALNVGAKGPNKAKDASGEEVALSSLFEFELKWPREEKKVESSSATQAPPQNTLSLNLSGIDLDNFFSEEKSMAISTAPSSYWKSSKVGENLSIEASSSMDSGGLDDFDSIRSAELKVVPAKIKGDNFDNSLAVWEASFQSAGSVDVVAGSISTDLFEDTSKSGVPEMQIKTDAWVSNQLQPSNTTHDEPRESGMDNISSIEAWTHDDVWQSTDATSMSSPVQENTRVYKPPVDGDLWEAHQGCTTEASDDPFDVWQDFTSSQGASDALANPLSGNELESITSKLGRENNSVEMLDGMDFGDFLQSDSLSSKISVASRQSEPADFDSLNTAETKTDVDSVAMLTGIASENICMIAVPQQDSSQLSVEELLSQMHNLSFMLETSLRLPNSVSG